MRLVLLLVCVAAVCPVLLAGFVSASTASGGSKSASKTAAKARFKAYDYAFAEVRAGDEAHDIFCECQHGNGQSTKGRKMTPEEVEKQASEDAERAAEENDPWGGLEEMCPNISAQCRKSFCKPLCLRMAWKPVVEVDCTQAPGWSWCPKFAAQVHSAARALEAHFQAHTCMRLHFCGEDDHMHDWVDNHSYGRHYPDHPLPVDGCVHEEAEDNKRELLCQACRRVVNVTIERGQCMPQFVRLQPGSLQERCLYMADVIGQRQDELIREFEDKVCDCLGCCGDGFCFFDNSDANWLNDLIDSVQQRVTAQLEEDGWVGINKRWRPTRKGTLSAVHDGRKKDADEN